MEHYYVLYTYTETGELDCQGTFEELADLFEEIDCLQAQGIDTYYEEEYLL